MAIDPNYTTGGTIGGAFPEDWFFNNRFTKQEWKYLREMQRLKQIFNPYWEPMFCRLCGSKISKIEEGSERSHIFETCGFCTEKVLNHIFKDLLKEENTYCQQCFRHIRACRCKKKKSLDNLKQ